MVDVPDQRLDRLAAAVKPKKVVPAQVRVADAPPGSRAQRIAAAREADVVIEVVRGFGPDPDPAGDLEGIELDLALTDLASVERRMELVAREVRAGRKQGADELVALEKAKAHLDSGRGLSSAGLDAEEEALLRPLFLVSLRPTVVIANVGDDRLPDGGDLAERLRELGALVVAAKPEARAWPCESEAPAPVAAGVIHSDFEKHFIRAEVTSVDDLVGAGSMEALRAAGRLRVEGRDYRVRDGDVVFFRVGR